MLGRPQDITFAREVKPSSMHTPIPVPHHWKKKVKEELDCDVALGIMESVPAGTPTVWCSRIVIAPNKNGSHRKTVNLQKLYAATMRGTHHTRSQFNQVSIVPTRTKKTILDTWYLYHILPLSPKRNSVHYGMGSLPIPKCTSRFSRVWRQIHPPIRRPLDGYVPKDSLHQRYSSLGRNH